MREKNMNTQPYKGSRDFYPEDKRLQKWLFAKWAEVCEKFGYEQYDAPMLEETALYQLKGSDEILSEQTYTFIDRGDRSVTMRTEMTPSVSRMVAQKRQELAYPLRWYSIPELWRYERPQRGRLRQFWQLNVDIFGVQGQYAEHEIISVADAIMQSVGAKRSMYQIKLNSRLFIDFVLKDYLGLDEVESATIRRLVDKMAKIDPAAFAASIEASMSPTARDNGAPAKLLDLLQLKSLDDMPADVAGHPSIAELKQLMALLKTNGITNTVFDISLMRGFDYYTDIVFEVFDTNPDNNRSMFGGGRYDGLVGLFGVDPVPTVGFGMGDVTFVNFLEVHGLMPALESETELYMAFIGDMYSSVQPVLAELREEGVTVAVDTTGRKLDKQIKTAEKKGIEFVVFVGEQEIQTGQFRIKNLKSGEEQTLSLARLITVVKDRRKK
ncbi:histidine--tRNA ligase [bacterium]|nr:histidine--tRNA ligase [bacterium]NBX98399.1 histidine--tRNA ligase [bacterium]NDC93697.1 histidine--tRNA ligase [bacterium]NDD82838.1 histidine--tRNA ligase [bacterium]NDG28633.1 histidine--tRNA ligase [bacterium]